MTGSIKFLTASVLLLSMAALASASLVLSEEAVPSNLKWRPNPIRIAVSSSLLRQNPNVKYDSDVAGAIRRSILTWQQVADIEIQEIFTDTQNVSPSGILGDGMSLITIAQTPENLLLFAKQPEGSPATTRIFYNRKGNITEADIVLNAYQQFSTDGTFGTYDLESVLTHEIGHLLGLEHSPVLSATMHENIGKNGMFSVQHFGARSLSAGDISAVRRLYGSREEDSSCCGEITGRLTTATGKGLKGATVWAENPLSGTLVAETTTLADGTFNLSGLPGGTYSLYSRDIRGARGSVLGDVVVEKEKPASVNKKIAGKGLNFELRYIGFNGQLSELAVPLSTGRSYTIFLGGKNLDAKSMTVAFNSRYLTVGQGSLVAHDFGDEISVVSFEVRVDPRAPKGEYSVFLESADGGRSVIPGALSVDDFANPWSRLMALGE